jgi:hypothetical protein
MDHHKFGVSVIDPDAEQVPPNPVRYNVAFAQPVIKGSRAQRPSSALVLSVLEATKDDGPYVQL